jgi:hypothetical protein
MTTSRNPTLGTWLMVAAVAAFAARDRFARRLAGFVLLLERPTT